MKVATMPAASAETGLFTGYGKQDARLILWYLFTAFAALLIGGIAGLLQGMVRSGTIKLPASIGYYELLTAHGILMAIVFTTFFIIGFLFACMARTCSIRGGALNAGVLRSGWAGYLQMLAGTILVVIMVLSHKATVLYTFYAPLKAHPIFYIGLVLVVTGSWTAGYAIFRQYYVWKKSNPGVRTPLLAFMAVTTMLLWQIATLGVAAEVLLLLLPWSIGWVDTVNVMLSRTLFWYFGHPLVYFWLLPAYMYWYACIPKVIGGKIFSDALARLSFILLLIFSIPVGFHHQLMEPGISAGWKYLQVVLTFMVIVPSLMTAFSLFASFELAGRAKGAKGLFGWIKVLPWKDVRFFAPFMGMLIFIPAGAGGIVNASNQMDAVVHNTLWVTGHFHLTVATSVALTFFGIAYWLIPSMTGRKLTAAWHRRGIVQTWIWVIGMSIMSGAMHLVGLFGAPRRTSFTTYGNSEQALGWMPYYMWMAIGGTILFIGVVVAVYNFIALAFFAPKGATEFPIGEDRDEAERTPALLERWGVWVTVIAVLVLVAYAIPVAEMINDAAPGSKPFVMW